MKPFHMARKILLPAVLLALGDTDFYVHQQERPVYEKPGEHGIV